jgi:DNA polymerase (family 10)
LSPDLGEPVDELLTVPGIGTGIAHLISEFRENGEIGELGRLAESLPLEAGRLRLLPRMTPGRLRWLKSEVGVETVQDLIEAITLERLGGLKGVGAETARTWVDRSEWLSLPGMAAHYWSSRLASHIERHVTGAEMIVTGSVRRLDEWVSEIDLVAAEDEGVVCFLEQSAVVTSVSQHPERSRFETLGATVNLYTPVPGTTAAAVFRTTGPTEHVEAVIESVGDREPVGLARTETDIYRTAGSTYIPPPARSGVLELPTALIGVEHLRGDLHLHSDWSPDGHQTIEELVHAARSKGLGYIAITDHAKGLRFGGLDEERIERQR